MLNLKNWGTQRSRFIAIIGLSLCLQGCAQINAILKPGSVDAAQVTIPIPASPPVTQREKLNTKAKTSVVAQPTPLAGNLHTEKAVSVSEINLSVYYLERIFLPVGSELTLALSGEGISNPVTQKAITKSGPPYAITVDLPKGAKFPLNINATLRGGSDQNFNGKITLNAAPKGVTELRVSPVL